MGLVACYASHVRCARLQIMCQWKPSAKAGCLVDLDAGSTYRLAQQNLWIPEHAHNRTLPNWLSDYYLSARDRSTLVAL